MLLVHHSDVRVLDDVVDLILIDDGVELTGHLADVLVDKHVKVISEEVVVAASGSCIFSGSHTILCFITVFRMSSAPAGELWSFGSGF
jgi:hypothetical protein